MPVEMCNESEGFCRLSGASGRGAVAVAGTEDGTPVIISNAIDSMGMTVWKYILANRLPGKQSVPTDIGDNEADEWAIRAQWRIGADQGWQSGNSENMELSEAAGKGDVLRVEQLVNVGVYIDRKDGARTPLMYAVENGHLNVVRFLVEHGAAVDARGKNRATPLMLAASNGHLDIVRFLVDHGALINDRNLYKVTPLIFAASKGHLDVVNFLVEQGAVVDACNNKSATPLMRSAENGHLDVVRFLVKQGAIVDAQDSDGVTPIMRAAGKGELDVVRYLVKHGAAVDDYSERNETPIMWAAQGGHLDVVRFLMEHGAVVDTRDSYGATPIMQAVEYGHLDVVQFLMDHGAVVDAYHINGASPIVWAAGGGHFDMMGFLVEQGTVVDAHDNEGVTPIMRAAENGHLDVVRLLMKHGAIVDAQDNDGVTPIVRAAEKGHLDVVRYLVKHGAAVDARGKKDVTPLMLAAKFGHLELVRFLVEHGADVIAHDSNGVTPIMCAAEKDNLEMVRFLVEHGAAADTHDNRGVTPIMGAVASAKLEMMRFLIEHGASVDVRNTNGWSPIMEAARGGNLEKVRILVEHGAAVNAHDKRGHTPILGAVQFGYLDVVRYLVEHGADVNVCENNGMTLTMRAAEMGNLEIVRFLVEHGANLNLISKTGNTALSIAAKFGRQEVVQFLLPLVRYQDRTTQTQNADEQMVHQANIPSSWLIPPFEVEVNPFINGGNNGGDYRGKWLDADVVVKLFVHDATNASFADEVRLWHQLRHPNILKLYGVCNSHHHLFVCEYASNGSLPEYLKSCDAEHRTPWKLLYEAALGLEYLHERQIIHGNLRGSNILIGSDGLARVSGFTLSASSSKERWYASGEWVRWAAPESFKGEKATVASDVYSLGMCILEAVSGDIPLHQFDEYLVKINRDLIPYALTNDRHLLNFNNAQAELVLAMCVDDACKRLQMHTILTKILMFAEIEAAKITQHTVQSEPEPLMNIDHFDEFDHGMTNSLWTAVQALVAQSENDLYRQMWHELKLIYETLKAESHSWSTLQRFHGLLAECQLALDTMSQQNRVYRLSATRARDYSVQGLHRRIAQLLQLVRPQDQNAEKRETEWKHLCREQVEVFVSEASEACVMLSSVDSEEDRSALVGVLRAELRNSDGKYTEKQLAILQKTYTDIVSKSLEDVHLATTPEWFIPWFELEMNEMATLGEGGFGSVIKAKWLDSEVVVKKLEIADKDAANVDKKREMRQMFEREVDIWFGLSHPHVVRLFGACHVGRPFFVCELAPNGTLDEYLRKHPDEIWLKLREAALGVQYLHARGIVHGDLKCNNIMIGSDRKAKVTDFGLSGVFGDDSSDVVVSGALHWVAPECLLGQKPTFASDVYSLGMCITEALRVTNGDEDDLPWVALPNAAVKFNVTRRHLLPPRPQNCSDEAWTLIERMCKRAPTERMLIMTVVDELEKLAGRHRDLIAESDEMVSDNEVTRLLSFSVADELAEMKCWIGKCDTGSDWEGDVLKNIYQLLWDRLEQVATQLFPDGEDTVVTETTNSDFTSVIDRSQMRTRAALGITGVIPLIKFTELALGGYALHRRLDKFMAAHAVPNDSSTLHDWTSACSIFLETSTNPTPDYSKEDCSVDDACEIGT